MPSAIVSSKGQITIPVQVRKRLGLVAGHRIDFVEMTSGQFALHAATVDIKCLRGVVGKPPKPVSVQAMNRAVRRRAVSRITRKRLLGA